MVGHRMLDAVRSRLSGCIRALALALVLVLVLVLVFVGTDTSVSVSGRVSDTFFFLQPREQRTHARTAKTRLLTDTHEMRTRLRWVLS